MARGKGGRLGGQDTAEGLVRSDRGHFTAPLRHTSSLILYCSALYIFSPPSGAPSASQSRSRGGSGRGLRLPYHRLNLTNLLLACMPSNGSIPLSAGYPLLLKFGEGYTLHFYTRVAVYIRDTYYVSVGEAGGPVYLAAAKNRGRPCG